MLLIMIKIRSSSVGTCGISHEFDMRIIQFKKISLKPEIQEINCEAETFVFSHFNIWARPFIKID
jgi:hypothetical protein